VDDDSPAARVVSSAVAEKISAKSARVIPTKVGALPTSTLEILATDAAIVVAAFIARGLEQTKEDDLSTLANRPPCQSLACQVGSLLKFIAPISGERGGSGMAEVDMEEHRPWRATPNGVREWRFHR
jgi:hypothetical protein